MEKSTGETILQRHLDLEGGDLYIGHLGDLNARALIADIDAEIEKARKEVRCVKV